MLLSTLRAHARLTIVAVALVVLASIGLTKTAATAAPAATPTKSVAAKAAVKTATATKKLSPKAYAKNRAAKKYKWGAWQHGCLVRLWHKESRWKVRAGNVNGGPYGIPQAYPGKKMGKGWKTSHVTQINWGLRYIDGRYGSPCKAEGHSKRTGWY